MVLHFRFAIAVAAVATIIGTAAFLALTAASGSVRQFAWIMYPIGYLSILVVPGAFLVGLVRDRAGYASIADLVRGLDQISPLDLQARLADTLQDRSLTLVFPVGDGCDFIDIDGRRVEIPDDGAHAVTMLGATDAPVAALIHDPVLSESPRLLEAAGAAANLALQNARLQAEVRAQLAEVRASRARIVTAGDDERRRLERNLHDGAQQRLFGIGIALQFLRSQLADDPAAGAYFDEIEAELREAIQELRTLAQGIHPAVLTDEGLSAAVGLLARRAPVPVVVHSELDTRPPSAVEAAAYFIISEALQNVAKHSCAHQAEVTMCMRGGILEIRVSDDGVGGAVVDSGSGSGLRGLVDRASAFEGTLDVRSEPGTGTEVRVSIPCE